MKLTKYLLPVAFAAMMTTACDTCDMDPVLPPVQAPTAPAVDVEANMTILELKQQNWSTNSYSLTQIGLNADGDSIILHGRVVSSDVTGNLYKQVVIRDETAAITFMLGINDVYKVYPYGADMFVNVTGLYIGMYNNFMQIGSKDETHDYPYQITEEDADSIFFANGWPDAAEAQPIEVDLDFLRSSKSDATARQVWQSQLVTVSDVEFESPGQEFSPTYSSTVSQYIRDNNGNRLILRFSGRSSFAHRIIPTGTGSITGILTFYNNDWQLIPCTLEDIKGFDDMSDYVKPEPVGDGSKENPYNVASAMLNQNGTGWVKGYIVGSMDTSSGEYIFETSAPFHMSANVYIADSPDETVTSNMLPVQLSAVRDAVNLVNHPENLYQEVMLKGTLTAYFNQPGLKECTAAIIGGKEVGDAGDAGETEPAVDITCTRVSSIADGSYVIWFDDNKVAVPYAANHSYGWLQVTNCTPAANGTLTTSNANLFTFKQEAKGWTIMDSNKNYLYQDAKYESFQLSTSPDMSSDYTYWTVTPAADGSFSIVNCATNRTILYSAQYGSAGAYTDLSRGTAPYLYQPAK